MYIDEELRNTISGKFFDMGNFSWLGISFVSLFSKIKYKWILLIIGIVIGVGFYLLGILIRAKGGRKR